MQGTGIVTNTDGENALVRIRKSSACGHDCGQCRICSSPEIEITVANSLDAKAGDIVLIGADTASVLWSTFLLYILPIIGAFFVYIISQAMSLSNYVTVFLVLIFWAVWFIFMKKRSRSTTIKSCILEVIHEKD